jgi:hypothetical protein
MQWTAWAAVDITYYINSRAFVIIWRLTVFICIYLSIKFLHLVIGNATESKLIIAQNCYLFSFQTQSFFLFLV